MTLVLTAATRGFVVQTADRLLTKQLSTIRPHDEVANKTILYRANDAVAVLSYSGLAYRNGQPTDEWLAELLWGAPIPRGRDGRRPATFGAAVRPNAWSLNRAIAALARALDAIPQREIDLGGMYLTLAGWRNHRGLGRPFLIDIARAPLAATATISGTKMRWRTRRGIYLGHIGARMPPAVLQAPFKILGDAGPLRDADVERTLVDLTRTVSAQQPTVGPNVLSLVLPKPGVGPIVCQFHAATPHHAAISSANAIHQVEVAHSPWVLGLMGWHAPQNLAGDLITDLDGMGLVIKGAALTSGPVLGLSSAISRPGP